jgi:hypothetical protein
MVFLRLAVVGIGLSASDSLRLIPLRESVSTTILACWADGRGTLIDARWFALDASRGFESAGLKAFMRMSVVLSDYLVFIPSLLAYVHYAVPSSTRKTDKVCPFELRC